MQFVSTRLESPAVSLSEGLTAGLAPDGGLYMPTALPKVNTEGMREPSRIARTVLAPFFVGDPLEQHLDAIVADAFAAPFPLVSTHAPRLSLLELFRGPTAAFKDFGARFLAASLSQVPRPQMLTILVATSGDTGSAVASAFHDRPGFRVVVLYPQGKVSPRQAHQLEAFGGNVTTLRVDGTFDDCQALVKGAFADTDLRRDVPMTSANSISLGRLLPQIVYHAVAATQLHGRTGSPVGLIVPTGNLGNGLAAWLAGAMGLPIHHVVLATNRNDAVVQWHRTGDTSPRTSVPTVANAMDVGVPSNLERLKQLIGDKVAGPALSAIATDDDTIRAVLSRAEGTYGHVVCPHTACALSAYERVPACTSGNWIAVATAHPAKFDTIVEPAVGHAVAPPEALAELLIRPRHGEPMANDLEALKRVLRGG